MTGAAQLIAAFSMAGAMRWLTHRFRESRVLDMEPLTHG
jgi:hypothetical protein